MTVSLTRLYDLLSEKVGKETAENLTQYIEDKIKDEVQESSKILATKLDLASLKDDLKEDIALVKVDIASTNENIANSKAETIKWMFLFWIGQVAVTFGFILLFLKN